MFIGMSILCIKCYPLVLALVQLSGFAIQESAVEVLPRVHFQKAFVGIKAHGCCLEFSRGPGGSSVVTENTPLWLTQQK